jgi:hypothetical protein
MEKFVINIHSMVDTITNSSTEIFAIDTDQQLSVIEGIIREKEKVYPNEYGYGMSVDFAEEWDIESIYGFYDDEDVIKYLKAKGYTVLPPNENIKTNKLITIKVERGTIDPRMRDFILETFNVVYNDTDG